MLPHYKKILLLFLATLSLWGSIAHATPQPDSDKRVAVVLLNFSNDHREPWTTKTIQKRMFTENNGVNAYFQEESDGVISYTGDVLGWLHLSVKNTSCDTENFRTQANQQLSEQGVDLGTYKTWVYIWPRTKNCAWAGSTPTIGAPYSFINGNITVHVIAHEVSHGLGTHHAAAIRCWQKQGTKKIAVAAPISNKYKCEWWDYGDPFSIMGGMNLKTGKVVHSIARHANVFEKIQIGALPSSALTKITQSGIYDLRPGTQLLQIPCRLACVYPQGNYYLEYRQPQGRFDNFSPQDPVVNGITIRIGPSIDYAMQTLLLDTTPKTDTFADSPLGVNKNFVDSKQGIRITVIAATKNRATVKIDLS